MLTTTSIANMAHDNRHCSPRRAGEPYAQYLDRYKVWKHRRDDEMRAVQRARLPTPDSSNDRDDNDHESDSESDDDTPGYHGPFARLQQKPSLTSARGVRDPTMPAVKAAMKSGHRRPSPLPSPTRSPEPHRNPAATRSRARTAAPPRGTARRRSAPDAPRQPRPSRHGDGGRVQRTRARHLRSHSRRLASTARQLLELDRYGHPRPIGYPQPNVP
ncbi:hypothetical protein QBC34DRAFT_102296 [Podospora aff. communis PSN243]|uniref:Uncharacterized protein n=1 Tax=Podospora aff. communis PSN243 TaxID=3040156 RepID=A0AAV9GKL0_9PEZI|nr:hypothetical protein QBC34DRAFT_102296 [Podospora aff. communis PSN243]